MNFIKNLLILAVLSAVGYGIYTSLVSNNADSSPPPGVAEGWDVAAPKVEMAGAAPSPAPTRGGPLAIEASPPSPSVPSGFDMGGPPPLQPAPGAAPAVDNPLAGAPPVTPVPPYPSSTPPADASPLPAAMLGAPTTPEAAATGFAPPSSGVVRNLEPPPMAPAAPTVAPPEPPSPADNLLQSKFAAFMMAVQQKLGEGKYAEAHLALSTLYGNSDLPAEQSQQITSLLDQLAGTVVFSRQHYLEPAYTTMPGETLDAVARKYNVPWLLLARINGLVPPDAPCSDESIKDRPLPPNTTLKVVRGPFDAVVHLDKRELTLMLQDRYAGRFPIGVGRDQPAMEGSYTVREKTLSTNNPQNPSGGAWIGLGDQIGIHGASNPQDIGRNDGRGSICVSQRDLQDLYGILSVGSRVTIMR